ncbi:hypothetical protein [Nostoc sp.]|uniref:hypothetical protein n=1 Tax=Nostoc sp. TaxID=1180 RepID=UPI002FF4E95B
MVTERLVSISASLDGAGVEPCRTTSLRDATRTWKQASKSVCLRHALRVRREVRAMPTQTFYFSMSASYYERFWC